MADLFEEYKQFIEEHPEIAEEFSLDDRARKHLGHQVVGPFLLGGDIQQVQNAFKNNFSIKDFPENLACNLRLLRHSSFANRADEEKKVDVVDEPSKVVEETKQTPAQASKERMQLRSDFKTPIPRVSTTIVSKSKTEDAKESVIDDIKEPIIPGSKRTR